MVGTTTGALGRHPWTLPHRCTGLLDRRSLSGQASLTGRRSRLAWFYDERLAEGWLALRPHHGVARNPPAGGWPDFCWSICTQSAISTLGHGGRHAVLAFVARRSKLAATPGGQVWLPESGRPWSSCRMCTFMPDSCVLACEIHGFNVLWCVRPRSPVCTQTGPQRPGICAGRPRESAGHLRRPCSSSARASSHCHCGGRLAPERTRAAVSPRRSGCILAAHADRRARVVCITHSFGSPPA